MGRTYDSPHEKIRQEFEILMGMNNTVMTELPAYTTAQLYQLADSQRRKHDVEITEVRDEGDGVYLLILSGGEVDNQAAAIGADSPEHLEGVDAAMLDDRRIGRQYDV